MLLVAWGLWQLSADEVKNQAQYYRQVSKRLHTKLQLLEESFNQVLGNLNQPETFSDFRVEVPYPYYIFRDDSLEYWSDFHYVPSFAAVKDLAGIQYVSDQGVHFIARAHQLKNRRLLVMTLPVHRTRNIQNNYIQEEFNSELFPQKAINVNIVAEGEGNALYTPENQYLFSFSIDDGSTPKSAPIYYLVFILVVLALLLALFYLYRVTSNEIYNARYQRALLYMTLGLVVIRAVMLSYDFPGSTLHSDIFNPQLYASSDLNHSLGDLFLNQLVLLAVAVFLFRYYRYFEFLKRFSHRADMKKALAVFWLALSLIMLYFQYHIIADFYRSQWSLDISAIMDFDFFKFLSLIIIVINAVIYFLITHIAAEETLKIAVKDRRELLALYAYALVVFAVVGIVAGWNWLPVALLNTLYLMVLYLLGIISYLGQYNYLSFLYLFIGSIQCAIIGAYAINTYEKIEDRNGKSQLADQLLNEKDVVGEFLLAEAMEKVKHDPFLINQMLFNPIGSSEAILQKINRIYINQHLDRYDITINIFDSRGDPDPMNESFLRYQDFKGQFAMEDYQSDYEGLYYINEITSDLLNRYLGFVELRAANTVVGYIIIDLQLKRVIPNTVYPELLVYNSPRDNSLNQYSYAIYLNGKLINNSGNFNYAKDFKQVSFENQRLFSKGINLEGYHHYGVKSTQGRLAVISSVAYPMRNILANFSLLFIIFIFSVIFFILGYIWLRREPVKLNYATRIQLYLNLAFFLPLLIVSLTTLSLISSSSKQEVIEQYFEKAEGIRNNIVNPLDDYLSGALSPEQIDQEITQIAQYSESDINMFNTDGRIISTSQPKIYEYQILSGFINPVAFTEIVEEENASVLLNESVGTLGYKSAYLAIRSFGSGDLLGILSIPFFESKYELDREIVVILTNILNIFTIIFIVILIASYFASRVLTVPLNMITQKIKKTTLTGYNEPLEWNSDDEIGLMVGEYNRMLQNLEASKTALARSEKESAWREMAQQVAHEIKNPLTPMKLTLQHLKRTLTSSKSGNSNLSEKPINSLLHQIDTLSDIATSFSSFAKMPVPENQRIEISSILTRTIQLHDNSKQYQIISEIEGGNHYITGDPQLMGRIFSNLIINGIQAVPPDRDPVIEISLKTVENKVVITFKDNGSGIPPDITHKIFIPNFSTKEQGSGIGLSIAKRGIEHAGGKIWVDSTSEAGTAIFVELPLVD